MKKPVLYLVATPVGHLGDISFRAVEVLKSCELILCEDTRHSQILLRHYHIDRPVQSFHSFNEKKQEHRLIRELKEGRRIALVSDAGSPLISDPGESLVAACIRENIPITAIPGSCSPILALQLSGLSAGSFQFTGFLPREPETLRRFLLRALYYPGTTIAFESPHRLVSTLRALESLDPNRPVAVARELTKAHEECLRGTSAQLHCHFQTIPPRGEIVLLIGAGNPPEAEMGIEETVELLRQTGLSLKEAVKAAARLKNLPKSEVYRMFVEK